MHMSASMETVWATYRCNISALDMLQGLWHQRIDQINSPILVWFDCVSCMLAKQRDPFRNCHSFWLVHEPWELAH